jgi:hypothetical protein
VDLLIIYKIAKIYYIHLKTDMVILKRGIAKQTFDSLKTILLSHNIFYLKKEE